MCPPRVPSRFGWFQCVLGAGVQVYSYFFMARTANSSHYKMYTLFREISHTHTHSKVKFWPWFTNISVDIWGKSPHCIATYCPVLFCRLYLWMGRCLQSQEWSQEVPVTCGTKLVAGTRRPWGCWRNTKTSWRQSCELVDTQYVRYFGKTYSVNFLVSTKVRELKVIWWIHS